MLKWEHAYELAKDTAGKTRADRWIVFIFFMIGLAVTVHLLNLLTVPAVTMIYYNKKYPFTFKKALLAFLAACALTGLILWGFVYIIPKWSAALDRIFVNSFGLPFFSGAIFFFILLGSLVWFLLRMAERKGFTALRLAIWCFIFVMIGYSTYVTTLIRSNANPGIDMSNVDNPMALASYFGREQYGSAPLIYGQTFAAQQADNDGDGYYDYKKKGMKWAKQGKKYVALGEDMEPVYRNEDMMIFPRIYDNTNQQDHTTFYAQWLNKGQFRDPQTGRVMYEKPTYGDNISWFFSYQMSLMYWRYFMWNFSGRQNDIQGLGSRRDGNWQTGISFIDNTTLGDQSKLPDSLKHNKANNKLFLLPFLLGILGCVYQFHKNKKDWWVNFLLFFFTGIAIGLYLNMPGPQPRERDYAFAGSFYAFCVWIGLAVVALVKQVKESKQELYNTIVYGSVVTFIITAFSLMNFTGSIVLMTSLKAAVAFALLTGILHYLLKAISGNGKNEQILNTAATVICLVVPLLMASQEWDDHDRGHKTLARDQAKNYLESCAPNAILFSFGDNDTYPLWYAQEVEKIRPDIRIINTSLLGIDWYINQLRYKINQSDSIDVILSPEQIIGSNRQYIQYNPVSEVPQDAFYDLYYVMKEVVGKGENTYYFPVKKFKVPVDSAAVHKNGTVNENDPMEPEMRFEIPGNDLTRDQIIILNIIAANKWNRPIYFTAAYDELGFANHLRKDGLSYRLTPVNANRGVNTNWMMDKLMTKFSSGNATRAGVYFDEENRRHLLGIRQAFGELARELVVENRKEDARKVLQKVDSLVPDSHVSYGMPSRYELHNQASYLLLEAAYMAEEKEVAARISKSVNRDMNQQLDYYAALGDNMSRKHLEDILMQYLQRKYSAQNNEQRNQAELYLDANLGGHLKGMSFEVSRVFEVLQMVKQTELRLNPAAAVPDSLSVRPDSNLIRPDTFQVKPDTAK
jgi:hypothetical protein